jgi:hypothetical protein
MQETIPMRTSTFNYKLSTKKRPKRVEGTKRDEKLKIKD